MSIRNLQHLFNPQSVALIGASDKPQGIGAIAMRNLSEGRYKGTILPVNPKYTTLAGYDTYRSVASLPIAPELALICTPAASIPNIISELGAKGNRAAIVLSSGLDAEGGDGRSLRQAMLDAAKPYLMRILGPDSVGLLVPALGLNAGFAHTDARAGQVAFVSQSGALASGLLDWASSRGIGFSKFIALGECADVDVGDVLDYLASDADTRAILLYVEDLRHARKFMSAARAAARSKPTLVLRAGRAGPGLADAAIDAAIRRAGMLRVSGSDDLFGAVETLTNARAMAGERLVILSNGAGPALMAVDALHDAGGTLAGLAPATIEALDALLASSWGQRNPVEIGVAAPPQHYLAALEALQRDPGCDAVLLIHAPSALADSTAIAHALAQMARASSGNVLACWLGGDAVMQARARFSQAGIASYDTPEKAVRGFMQIVQYHRNQHLLMQVPPSPPGEFLPERARALALVRAALAEGRTSLSEPEAKNLLASYGIPAVLSHTAASVEAAVDCARQIGFPVALKILAPNVAHRFDLGGVVLDLDSPEAVRAQAQAMHARVEQLLPGASLQGFCVQAMARRPQGHALTLSVRSDPLFGPVILCGQGGAGEQAEEPVVGLPPLNAVLARDMLAHTRIGALLADQREHGASDAEAICRTLIALSQLVTDLAEVIELDIEPLLVDGDDVLALDVRVRLCAPGPRQRDRLAIRPYPQELEQHLLWQGQQLVVRPVKPEDGAAHARFFKALAPEDVHFRTFSRMRELQPSQLARLTQIDYDREMAFIASRAGADGGWETLGVARSIADPDNSTAEFAVIVRSDLKGQGLGKLLMHTLIAYCRSRATGAIVGEALAENVGVLKLVRGLGFGVTPTPGDNTMQLRLALDGTGVADDAGADGPAADWLAK